MVARHLVRSLGLLVALTALTVSCGGAVYTTGPASGDSGSADTGSIDASPGDGGPHDSGGTEGSVPDASGGDSSAPWSPVCPDTQPATGSSCSTENVQCEYGDSWWSVSCDPVVQCQSGHWGTFQPSFEPCSAKPGPNSAQCPSTYAAVSQGSSCTDTSLSCVYEQGECSCQMPLGGPVQIDGGSAYWGCEPGQGCPFPRPRIGAACSDEGTSCTYEACSYAQTCQGGAWQGQEEACATPGGGTGSP
jgi:hypothetical protein